MKACHTDAKMEGAPNLTRRRSEGRWSIRGWSSDELCAITRGDIILNLGQRLLGGKRFTAAECSARRQQKDES